MTPSPTTLSLLVLLAVLAADGGTGFTILWSQIMTPDRSKRRHRPF